MELRERQKPTLKEKLKAHYQTKDKIFQPDPTAANKFGVAFFLYMCFALLIETLFIILPALFVEYSPWKIVLTISCVVIFFQSILNWLLTMKIKSAVVAQSESSSLTTPEGWRTCLRCQLDAPPRSHHCNLCGVCVLKRDHHCYFTACCIGFYNQRRFIVLLFYTVLANTIASVTQFLYLNQSIALMSWDFYNYIPFVAAYKFAIGDLPFTFLFVLIHLMLTIFCLSGSCFFFIWQLVVVCRGQTSNEVWKNISQYETGILDGLRSVFGPYGLIHFLFPFQVSLVGDGINWQSSLRHKGH